MRSRDHTYWFSSKTSGAAQRGSGLDHTDLHRHTPRYHSNAWVVLLKSWARAAPKHHLLLVLLLTGPRKWMGNVHWTLGEVDLCFHTRPLLKKEEGTQTETGTTEGQREQRLRPFMGDTNSFSVSLLEYLFSNVYLATFYGHRGHFWMVFRPSAPLTAGQLQGSSCGSKRLFFRRHCILTTPAASARKLTANSGSFLRRVRHEDRNSPSAGRRGHFRSMLAPDWSHRSPIPATFCLYCPHEDVYTSPNVPVATPTLPVAGQGLSH